MNAYEPEEYPRCTRCGRLALHAKSTLCAMCLIAPAPPFSQFTASDFAPTAKKR